MSMIAYHLDADNQIRHLVDADEVVAAFRSQSGLLWVDLQEPDDGDRGLLVDEFDFHPLVVNGAMDPDIRPARVENFGGYIYVNARSIDYTIETEIVETTNIGIFIGETFVVTVHNTEMPSVEAVKQIVEIDGRPMMKGPGFFAHALFDALIQAILPTLDLMVDRADAIEEQVLTDPDQSALIALMALKRSCLGLNRALAPQREVLNRLGRREFNVLGQDVDLYFRDLADDLARVQTSNDAIRERTDTSLATYLSVVGNRQNEIMKVLSIVATVFLPLGLVAGIFGMNFDNMPGIGYQWGSHVVVGVSIASVLLVGWMFWIKRWVITGAGFFRPRRLKKLVPQAVDPTRLAGHLVGTVGRNIQRTGAVIRPVQRPIPRWRPSVLQRINPISRGRESNQEETTSDS